MIGAETPRLHAAVVRWLEERANEGNFTTNRELVIQSWNTWMIRATGIAASDAIGRRLLDVRPEIAARGLDKYYRRALDGQSSILSHHFHNHLLAVSTPSGEMPQSALVAPLLTDEQIIGTITVVEDVTERVNSEAALRRQIAVADDARHAAETALRVKDEFLATLSHELRTPLNAVLGWTNILRSSRSDPVLLERALLVIERNATAQARLIDDMLDMARIASGKIRLDMTVVDVVAITSAAMDVIGPSAGAKRVVIRTNFAPGPILVQGDAARMQQIIWNVLSNAVKFTPPDGTIDVTVAQHAGTVSIVITDSGKGITPEFLPYVFDRFRQANSSTNRSEGGLGLGLALVKQLVNLQGGEVGITSLGDGRGTTVTVMFPSISVADPAQLTTPLSPDPQMLAGHRILIVDDDVDWCGALCAGLQARGAHVDFVRSAREAIDYLAAAPQRVTALILDIGLPGDDGYTLIQQIRRLEGNVALTPAIAVTAYAGAEHERRALSCGFDAFRLKPIAVQTVAATVAHVVDASDRLP